jgi:hypothetical protein
MMTDMCRARADHTTDAHTMIEADRIARFAQHARQLVLCIFQFLLPLSITNCSVGRNGPPELLKWEKIREFYLKHVARINLEIFVYSLG